MDIKKKAAGLLPVAFYNESVFNLNFMILQHTDNSKRALARNVAKVW